MSSNVNRVNAIVLINAVGAARKSSPAQVAAGIAVLGIIDAAPDRAALAAAISGLTIAQSAAQVAFTHVLLPYLEARRGVLAQAELDAALARGQEISARQMSGFKYDIIDGKKADFAWIAGRCGVTLD
jgi:hypothetical protein